MNTDRNSGINRNLDPTFYYDYDYSASAVDLDFSFFDEDELSEEQLALKRLYHGITLNNQHQQRLQELLLRIQEKIEKNNQKLDKVNEIIVFKNKRNKIQLKKKHIEFYKYEDTKLPPESFKVFEQIGRLKAKKKPKNFYEKVVEGDENSSIDEDLNQGNMWRDFEEEKDFVGSTQATQPTQPTQNFFMEIQPKKEVEEKPVRKPSSSKKSPGRKEKVQFKAEPDSQSDRKVLFFRSKEEDEEDNDMDYDDDLEMEVDSEDEMRSIKRRGDRLGLDTFLEEHKGRDPREIDWLVLARKVNSKLILQEKSSLVTGLDLYRRFIADEVQKKRTQWSEEDDKALLNAVKVHGTNNWKQVANNIEGKNTYLCFQRWAKFVNPNISKGKWNLEEDLKLVLAVECFKAGNWIAVASLFKSRTDVQCRERWCNILDPALNGREWTKQEDQLLLLAVIKYGKRWAQVSKMLKNRTDNQCWRRWKILSKRSKNAKALNERRDLDIIGIKNMKINMVQPFKVQNKKQKLEGPKTFKNEPDHFEEDKTDSKSVSKSEPKKRGRRRGPASSRASKKSGISNGDSENIEDFE